MGRDPAAQALSWGQQGRWSRSSLQLRSILAPASPHPSSSLARGRAFAVGAGKGLSLAETFALPEQPWLPCERRHVAHARGQQAGGAACTPRGGHGHPPPPAEPTLLPCNSLAAPAVDKLKVTANALPGCAGPSRCSRGSSRPPALGRDGGEPRTLPAAGRAWQDLPVPTGHGQIHPVGPGPPPAPCRRPGGLSWCGGKAVPASNEMINL